MVPGPPDWTQALNARLDALAGDRLRVGGWVLPTFLVSAGIGLWAAGALFLGLVLVRGLEPALALGLVPILLAAGLGWSLIRRRATRVETWVLLEHVFVLMTVSVATLLAAKQPLWPWLDLVAVSLSLQLAFGRFGCCAAGCCHGRRSEVGIHYGPSYPGPGRRFPVPLIELLVWGFIAASGTALVFMSAPGTACLFAAAVYAPTRIVLESLRDDRRPVWFGLTESRWLSGLLLLAAGGGYFATYPPSIEGASVAATGLALALGLWATAHRWLGQGPALDPAVEQRFEALGARLQAEGPSPSLRMHSVEPYAVAASWALEGQVWGLYLSLSSPAEDPRGGLDTSRAHIIFDAIARGLGLHEAPAVWSSDRGLPVARFQRPAVAAELMTPCEPDPVPASPAFRGDASTPDEYFGAPASPGDGVAPTTLKPLRGDRRSSIDDRSLAQDVRRAVGLDS